MDEIRRKKLEGTIVKEISRLIMRQRTKDDRIGFVSVTGVKLMSDLKSLTVNISPFGNDGENKETLNVLNIYARFFQSRMGRNLRLRLTPRIAFQIDNSIKEGDKLLELLESDNK